MEPLLPVNRLQRRAQAKAQKAAKRKTFGQLSRWHREKVALSYNPGILLDACSPYEPHDLTDRWLKIMAAFERIKSETADKDDFDLIAICINIAKIRALDIHQSLADDLERSQDAMVRCKTGYLDFGKFGFSRTDLPAVENGLTLAKTIEEKSSPQQMIDALRVMVQSIERTHARKGETFAQELHAITHA